MALDSALLDELKATSGRSEATLSRWATRLNRAHGPMSTDEARWVIAHDLGVDLDKHLTVEQLDRVSQLRARGARWPLDTPSTPAQPRAVESGGEAPPPRAATPRSRFDERNPHPRVVRSSRKLFVTGARTEAVRKAFVAVNNRVKKITKSGKDGSELMFAELGGESPKLSINPGQTESERNEQLGATHLFAGAMLSQRNPRSHEDQWPPDDDTDYTLDCLGLASLLHRILDRVDP